MTWIKICGTTNLEDARLAAEVGADALGFVFAKSPRRVTPEAVRDIAVELPASVEIVGVFVNASPKQILDTVETAGLTGVQLHDQESVESIREFRGQLAAGGRKVKLLAVWRLEEFPPTGAFALDFPTGADQPDALLLDSRSPAARGGTGTSFDWKSWGTFLEMFRLRKSLPPLVVGGGLKPDNVGQAMRFLQPWGVDVVTGVEKEPGKKDSDKVRAFVQAVRQADKELRRP